VSKLCSNSICCAVINFNFCFVICFSKNYFKQKKRLFGESSVYENMDGGNHFEIDLTANMAPSVDLVS
jgi:hypothetical protein